MCNKTISKNDKKCDHVVARTHKNKEGCQQMIEVWWSSALLKCAENCLIFLMYICFKIGCQIEFF